MFVIVQKQRMLSASPYLYRPIVKSPLLISIQVMVSIKQVDILLFYTESYIVLFLKLLYEFVIEFMLKK